MKNFKQFINEKEMTSTDMGNAIQKNFRKQFPKGWIIVRAGAGISKDTVSVTLGLIGDKKELTSGILENDPMFHSWLLFKDPKGWSAEITQGRLSVNPPEGTHYAMGSVKTKWRKTAGDENKMINTFATFFQKLKKIVKDNEDEIYQRSKYSDKFFK